MSKKSIDVQKYKNIPHFDLIKENGTLTIPSVFMFDEFDEFFAFLHVCKVLNCTVIFENENFTTDPKEDDSFYHLKLSIYMTIKNCKNAVGDYFRYLTNIEKMKWENCK